MRKILGLTFFLIIFTVTTLGAAPVVSVSYSHRQVAHRHVDPEIPEGSVIATFTSENSAQVIGSPSNLEPLSDTQWRYIFTWDHTDDLTLQFTDASAETTIIVAFPQPLVPLNPLQHQMPVLDIRTAASSLWDPATGLYVFGLNENCLQRGSDWERPAQFIFYNESLSPEFSEQTGLRINGGWSRRFNQKGLRFYFDDYGNSDQKEYDFFGSEPTSFRRLIMRCGVEPRRCFTDILAAETFAEMGHLTSRWAPLAVYLNGEYWGFYPLRERIDDEFIEHTHGLDGDGYALIKDGETKHGDSSSFWAFMNECRQPGDFSSHEFFVHAQETFDLISYIDWLIINIYGATTDNGSASNSAQYKLGNQPWQFMVWDEDGLFYFDNYWDDFFHFLSINSQEEYDQYLPSAIFTGSATARIRWAAPFRALLQNSEFKHLFAQRYLELMSTSLSRTSLDSKLDGIVARQESEMARHGERWDWPVDNWYQLEINQLRSWFYTRPGMLESQFNDFMEEHRAPVELVQFSSQHTPGISVTMSWNTNSEDNCSGYVLYRGTNSTDLNELVSWTEEESLGGVGGLAEDAQYSWVDETISSEQIYYYQLAWVDRHGSETLLPWIEQVSTQEPVHLFINEFLASNQNGIEDETGTREDWVEIFNQGPGSVNLSGYFLTDDTNAPTRWEFPETLLDAGDFLLVWCDSDPEDGPLHTNFKLSAAGETLALMSPLTAGNQIIDERVFGNQVADISEGRQTDGHDNWISFETPTPGASNLNLSGVAGNAEKIPGIPVLKSISPNPFNPSTTISFTLELAGSVKIQIYDLKGKLVRDLLENRTMTAGKHSLVWDGRNNRGLMLASGPYFLRIGNSWGDVSAKLLLVK